MGVSLTEQGFGPVPAGLLDWLKAIDGVVNEHEQQQGGSDGT